MVPFSNEHAVIEHEVGCSAIDRALMPNAVRSVDENAVICAVDALHKPVLTVPGVCATTARQRVAISIVHIVVRSPRQEHVGGVIGIVLSAARRVLFLEAVAHRVEGIRLCLAVAVVHRFQAVQLVIIILLSSTAAAGRDLVGQPLSRVIEGISVLHEAALLPLSLRVLVVPGIGKKSQPSGGVADRTVVIGISRLHVGDEVQARIEGLVASHEIR